MPLILLILEIALVVTFVQNFGFLNFFLFYALSTVLGIVVVSRLGAQTLREFQNGQASVSNYLGLSKALLFVSGLLLIVPSMWTKAFGVILLAPPIRWLVSAAFKTFLLNRIFSPNSFIHQFGKRGFAFYYQSNANPFNNQPNENLNDEAPDVIDAKFRKIDDPPKQLK